MLWGIPGVLAGALLATRLGASLLWPLGGIALGLGVFLLRKGKAAYALPLLLGLVLLRGAILPAVEMIPGEYTLTGTVIDEPERGKGETTLIMGRVALDGKRVPEALALTVPFDASIAYGDFLSLQAWVSPGGRGAARALTTVQYEGRATGEITVKAGRASLLYGLALSWRERLGQAADALFADRAGVAKAMLFGDRDDVHYLTFLAYRRSGLLHLLTVSGLHVGVVCGAALRFLRGRRRWLRFLLSALVLLFFCLLTGLSPSSVRAAIMLLVVRFSHLLDRQEDPLSEIGCALTLLILIDPWFLFSSGFCLSFGAIWGLFCMTGPLTDLLHGRREGLGGLVAGALGVFLGTLPLLSVTGNQVSWIGVLLSPLALPAAPLFLIPGWIAVLLHPVLPLLAKGLALLPQGVLYYFDALAGLVPLEGLTLPPCNGIALLLWFAGMLFVSEYFLPNRQRPAYLGWGLMATGALVWFFV